MSNYFRNSAVPILLAALVVPLLAHHSTEVCGTTQETPNERIFLHRQSLRSRGPAQPRAAVSGNRDIGNIAIIEDTDGVVARQNQFNLDGNTLRFTPSGPHYSFAVAPQGYDASAASNGIPLAALDDDDSRIVTLPFAFPFFGVSYTSVYVNSDGNLTFTTGESASTDRSLGRMTAGPPRISPLFDDLDPALTAGGVRVLADSTRVVVSWVAVPEWQSAGIGVRQTFQAKVYPDGAIEFSYSGATPTSAVVGIAPGNLQGTTALVDFRNDPSASYSAAVAERFGNTLEIDPVTVAQKFYQTHEDAYDYLMIYNNEGIGASPTAVAYENTVRSSGSGYGAPPTDTGQQYGSASRLQSAINMGDLQQYPVNPNQIVPLRGPAGDTPLTILAHETGHLFLAFASVPDPDIPGALPMLNTDHVHWSFVFDSEASMVEGERIVDRGSGGSPEFQTTDTAQQYAPLDQYLMGFRPPSQVPPGFYVANTPSYLLSLHPARGVTFDGTRRDFTIDDVIRAQGRRTPDDTVAQRRFRFGFILVVAQGSQPSAADLAQIDNYRQQFEPFYNAASSGNAVADTKLARSMKLSLFPSSGVATGLSTTATLTLKTAPSSDLTVTLQAPNGVAGVPASVKIPAGATSASFPVSGVKAGVEEITATSADSAYETAFARVQVAGTSFLKLESVPILNPFTNSSTGVRLTDMNNLAYPGVRILAVAADGSTVTPAAALTDAAGLATFNWTPGTAPLSHLQLSVETLPSVNLTLTAGPAARTITSVVNAASFQPGIAAGAFETIFGTNLAGGQPQLNGTALNTTYTSDTQINFYVPSNTALGDGALTVTTPDGTTISRSVTVTSIQPGIFPGAVLHAGTATSAITTPVHAGDYIEIYCTGLGPTTTVNGLQQTSVTPTVFIGAQPLTPIYSGLAPGVPGLYQVDVQVPAGLAPGPQSVLMSVNQAHSNQISITVQ